MRQLCGLGHHPGSVSEPAQNLGVFGPRIVVQTHLSLASAAQSGQKSEQQLVRKSKMWVATMGARLKCCGKDQLMTECDQCE